ncbi:MAG: nucleotidyltransferase, partial [Pirellulales bacterium]|nr:nucleotidyltransferase [Pirellulales bacterium]
GLQIEVKGMGYLCDAATLIEATSSSELLIPAGKELLARMWMPGMTVTRMNVMADRLAMRGEQQMSLFRPKDKQIDRVKAMVNDRCGRFTLRSAETLPLADIYRDTANEYDICDIYGKSCF